jgi:TatD family-associated radical SAM protein
MDSVGESQPLWLDHAPVWHEIESAFKEVDLSQYTEVVFCGFGEPTEALENMLRLAGEIKKLTPSMPVRVNTNGLGSLVNEKNIAPLFDGLIDEVSISLNAPDKERYLALARPRFGMESFDAMLDFAREVKKYVKKVVMTTVSTVITEEEETRCAEICKALGASYRIRKWEE